MNRREFLIGGVAFLSDRRQYLAEGDSITYGIGTQPLTSYARILGAEIVAHDGDTLPDWNNRAEIVDSLFQRGGKLSLLPGNDLYGLGYPGGLCDCLNGLCAYLDARRRVGWKMILCTTLARDKPPTFDFDAFRLPCNAAMRGWVGVHCDALCDFAAIEGVTLIDGIHPNNSSHQAMAEMIKGLLDD